MSVADSVRLLPLVVIAMNMHEDNPFSATPTADPRLSPDWQLLGHLTAVDAIWRGQPGQKVSFGFLARSTVDPNQYVVAIRGTDEFVEWVEDAIFDTVPHPVAGEVEAGFWGLYESLEYQGAALLGAPERAAEGIAAAVGPKGRVTVVGHSLGSALASYLTFDLAALMADRVSAALFASPRPGDAAFAQAFDKRVAHYTLFNYSLDAVPHVPFGLGYSALPQATVITPDAGRSRIRFDLFCGHHAVSYIALLDPSILKTLTLQAPDSGYTTCIKGIANV